jgi:hypothetical protein
MAPRQPWPEAACELRDEGGQARPTAGVFSACSLSSVAAVGGARLSPADDATRGEQTRCGGSPVRGRPQTARDWPLAAFIWHQCEVQSRGHTKVPLRGPRALAGQRGVYTGPRPTRSCLTCIVVRGAFGGGGEEPIGGDSHRGEVGGAWWRGMPRCAAFCTASPRKTRRK